VQGFLKALSDPVVSGALQMRRFYVRQTFRRSGIAPSIALTLLEQAIETAIVVTLNAAPGSVRFWERLGFVPDPAAGHTHILQRSSGSRMRPSASMTL